MQIRTHLKVISTKLFLHSLSLNSSSPGLSCPWQSTDASQIVLIAHHRNLIKAAKPSALCGGCIHSVLLSLSKQRASSTVWHRQYLSSPDERPAYFYSLPHILRFSGLDWGHWVLLCKFCSWLFSLFTDRLYCRHDKLTCIVRHESADQSFKQFMIKFNLVTLF